MVPYLPSLDTYAHVPFGIWIPTNATVVLEDRPPEDISDLNWCASTAPLLENPAPRPLRCFLTSTNMRSSWLGDTNVQVSCSGDEAI